MPETPRVWLAIPVYNHSAKLPDLIRECLRFCPETVVVDDGSTDCDMANLLSGMKVHLISHPANLGKGRAIMTAADYISSKGGSHIITIDSDGQHVPGELPRFLEAISRDDSAIIIGARNFARVKIPWKSRSGRSISNFLIWLETGTTIRDSQSGFRSYPSGIFKILRCSCSRFSFETEILVRGVWAGYRVMELDIPVIYPKGKDRISHFGFFADNLRIAALHMRLLCQKLYPFRKDNPEGG